VIVLDASAAVEWLLRLPNAEQVERRLADADVTLHAPHLLAIEVAQVVRRYEAKEQSDSERAALALANLADLDIEPHGHMPLLPLVWELRHNLAASDAAYVALARVLDAPLVTLDQRLADSTHGATVDVIG